MSRGLAGELGYQHSSGNPVQLAIRWVAGTSIGARALSHSLRHADSVVARLTGGRHSAPRLLTGISVLQLTTTGRRSGAPRTSHLIATPHDGTLALLGTNFGQPATPAWVLNLEADARAVVTHRGISREVVARLATREQADAVFAEAATFYPGYLRYRRRIGTSRQVRVFVLEPAPRRTAPRRTAPSDPKSRSAGPRGVGAGSSDA